MYGTSMQDIMCCICGKLYAFGLILQCKICCLFSFRITLSHAVVAVEIETEEEREETNGRRERNKFFFFF